MSKHKFIKSTKLSDDFPAPSYEDWRQAVDKLLKGAPYEKIMLTKTYEGITLEPMYRKEDVANLKHLDAKPGEAPFVRGTNPTGYIENKREIAQEIRTPSPDAFNKVLLNDLSAGQNVVNLILDAATQTGLDSDKSKSAGQGGVAISTLDDLQTALQNVDLQMTPLHIACGESSLAMSALYVAMLEKNGVAPNKIMGSLTADPLAALVRIGRLTMPLSQSMDDLSKTTKWAASHAPQLATIGIDVSSYHNAGASAVQELAYAVASGLFYLRELQERGLSIDEIAKRMRFTFSLGTNFFMEIAKLRAARMLWSQIVAECDGNEDAQKMVIHAKTSIRNKTVYDPYVNMLRTTTEAFSGVLAGVDSMHIGAFDEVFRESDQFSRRIARNTHIILDEETHLNRVIDPAGGSWYIEKLTSQIAEQAWTLFQETEGAGGMFQALEQGLPQKEVAKVAESRWKNLATRKDKLVGTNMYANKNEELLEIHEFDLETFLAERKKYLHEWRNKNKPTEISDDASIDDLAQAAHSGATIGAINAKLRQKVKGMSVPTLKISRLAEPFEKLRDAMMRYEKDNGNAIKVFLANLGPVIQHKPRADFSAGFFEVAGFDVIGTNAFNSIDDAVAGAIQSEAPIVVLCSTDATYPDVVPQFAKKLKAKKPATLLILAGYPKEYITDFQKAGIDEFIHVRANAYEILAELMKKTGGAQ